MEDSVLEQDATFAGAEARGQSGASPVVSFDKVGGTPITQIQSGTSGFSAPSVGGIATLTSPLTAKGDIFVRNASQGTRQPIGADGQALVADSAQATGMKWSPVVPSASGFDFAASFLLAGA